VIYTGCAFLRGLIKKLALLVFKCLNGLAPPYLACEFRRVADIESQQRLSRRRHRTHIILRVLRAAIGGFTACTFPRNYGTVPSRVTSLQSLNVFKSRLKTELFHAMLLGRVTLTYREHLLHVH
jgi:hypothetical protein